MEPLKSKPRLLGVLGVVVFAAAAGAQFPGAPKLPGKIPAKVPSLSSFLEGKPPITTSLEDALTEITYLDGYEASYQLPLTSLPQQADGGFRLRPGAFVFDAESYCLKAGSHGPGGGDGYLYAPLAGPKGLIVRHILQNSVSHPEIPQHKIQVLLWAIIARTKISDTSAEIQQTAAQLLTRKEIRDLDGGALGLVPDSVMREATGRLPPAARQVFEAEAQLRHMLTVTNAPYAELERVAVLAGNPPLDADSRPVPTGRWSYHPDGYFIRFLPSGYSRTQIHLSVPTPGTIERDARRRIKAITDRLGNRIEVTYDDTAAPGASAGPGAQAHSFRSIRFSRSKAKQPEAQLQGVGWTLAGGLPAKSPASGTPARFAGLNERSQTAHRQHAEWEGVVARLADRRGVRAPSDLRELHELAQFRLGLEAAFAAHGPQTAAQASALEVVTQAWQAAFCRSAGCTSMDPAADLLILGDGETRVGELQGCAASSCTFAYSPVNRESIAWIGLRTGESSPPAVRYPDADEVHLVDGSIHPGRLLGISASRVFTDRASFERLQVTWVHLAGVEPEAPLPPSGAPPGGPGEGEAPPEPGPPQEPPPPPPPPEAEPPGPTFDPSDPVATPGNRGRQRLGQSGRGKSPPSKPPKDDPCAGERRNLMQAEALLDLHDRQMQDLADRYSRLYDQLVSMNAEWAQLQAKAQAEWNQFRAAQVREAFTNIVGAFLPVPPDQGAISAASAALGFYQFYQANRGTIDEMRAWAQSQSGNYDLNDLLAMLNHMDRMGQVTAQMTMLKHDYDEMQVNRQKFVDNVEDARAQLEACLAANR